MGTELNFEAMPFEAYEALASEQSGFELEEEFGRRARSRSRQGFAPRVKPKRPGRPPVVRPGKPKKTAGLPAAFPALPARGRRGCGRRAFWWCARALWRRARAIPRRTSAGRLGVHALGAKRAE